MDLQYEHKGFEVYITNEAENNYTLEVKNPAKNFLKKIESIESKRTCLSTAFFIIKEQMSLEWERENV